MLVKPVAGVVLLGTHRGVVPSYAYIYFNAKRVEEGDLLFFLEWYDNRILDDNVYV